MTLQDKAYCGDAIAQLIIGEAKPVSTWKGVNVNSIYLSNASFEKAYQLATGKKGTATNFEAMLYDLYTEQGYGKAKEFFIKYVIRS